jgi:DNA/RNA-binding domain of Phe-tRNA-synthetase-like protein
MSLQARTQGISLGIDEGLRGILALGLLEVDGVRLDPLPPEFDAESDRVIATLAARCAGKQPGDIAGVAETRALFHRLGVDPTKTRPSSEALLRRVLQGKGLPRVNPAVDVCNLCSLESQIPLGLYDRDRVQGSVYARLGKYNEGYPGIRKQRVNLHDRLTLADEQGAFGAPTSDSARTAVSPETRALLVVLFCPVDRAGQHLSAALESIADRLGRYCRASVVAVRVVR